MGGGVMSKPRTEQTFLQGRDNSWDAIIEPRTDNDLPVYVPICGPLEFVAATRNHENGEWGTQYRFTDPDGVPHTLAIPRAMLATAQNEVKARFLDEGLRITPEGLRALFIELLQWKQPTERIRCVSKIGWNGDRYALPDKIIGPGATEEVFQSAEFPTHLLRTSGTR